MSETIIAVENLGKRYTLGPKSAKHDGFRHRLEEFIRSPAKWISSRPKSGDDAKLEFWALDELSFEIKRGEVVGVIGRNGAGKSTLLKILSRITEPTKGRITINGRVASLLEVGTGFHPELTGRENIFLNGAILGMSRNEIRRKFDEIVAFSEVEKFLDTPVKRYSSGMYVRLAFSVAAHLEPDILVVDEVLAVGDAKFQQKCMGKIEGISKGSGRTVLFVSHSMAAVSRLCTKCLALDAGRLLFFGKTSDAIALYSKMGEGGASSEAASTSRLGTGQLRYSEVSASRPHFTVEETKIINFKIATKGDFAGQFYVSGVLRQNEAAIFQFDSRMLNEWYSANDLMSGSMSFSHPWLKPGQYIVDMYICSPTKIVDEFLSAVQINIVEELPFPGIFDSDAYRFGTVLPNFIIELK